MTNFRSKVRYDIDNILWVDVLESTAKPLILDNDTDVVSDLFLFRGNMKMLSNDEADVVDVETNKQLYFGFLKGCIRKFGEDKIKVLFESDVFYRLISFI